MIAGSCKALEGFCSVFCQVESFQALGFRGLGVSGLGFRV